MTERPFIPYNRPAVGEEEIAAVAAAIRSGWLTTGPLTHEFEQAFAACVGANHAIAVSSCTAGMEIALAAYGIGPGDEVITSAYTFASTVNVIVHRGARPVLVDIREDDFNLDPELVERAVTPRTRAIIPVHYGGQPCRMGPILEIARRANLRVIEDAAHAVWARDGERAVGNIGDATSFSFYATKNLATGEGGMVTLNDGEIAERIRRLSLHGLSRHAWTRYGAAGTYRYDVTEAGYKANLTDIQAALGLTQLRRLPELQRRRELLAALYQDAFSENQALEPPIARRGVRHAWHLYPLRLNLEQISPGRDGFIESLRSDGVGTSVHFIPIHYHSYYRDGFGWKAGDFPVSERTFEREVSLPLYPDLSDAEADRVIAAVLRAARG